MDTSFETYLPWYILREIPGLGNIVFKTLIKRFKTPTKILQASKPDLKKISGIKPRVITGILNHKKFKAAAKKELDAVFKSNAKIITLTDKNYPPLLADIDDPPPFLTYVGHLDNSLPCLSIVGSRNATSYGLNTAKNLSAKLAQKGFQIVSGMARGIDTQSHRGALEADKPTIAVLGSGLNKIYPKENKALFENIQNKGAVFSEFKINCAPLPNNFPVRNRIIAGLSCGTLVVEAAKRSGSLITARLAGEYNREVFAIPGSISSSKSQGTHSLLKQGAKLVEDEMDIIDELGQFIHTKKIVHPTNDKKRSATHRSVQNSNDLLSYLDPYPIHMDTIIENSKQDSASVASQLLELELSGCVKRHQGNYYSISEENH